ncbi:MAG: hypothetical protein ACRDJJ_07930 [Actinomycetota bacterium]
MKRSLIVVTASLMLLAACGGDGIEGDPKQALADAFRGLGQAEGLTVTATLQSTAESLQAAAQSEGDRLSEENAAKILSSSVTVSGKSTTDPSEAQSEIAVNVAGTENAIQVRVISNTLYARADVRSLLETFEQDPASVDAFVQQAEASGLDFVRPAVDGEWLSISGLDAMQQQLGMGQPTPSGVELERVFDRFAEDIEGKATVTEGDVDGPGTHLIVEIGARDVVDSFLNLARELGQAIPPNAFPSPSDIPDRQIRVNTWVEGDFVRQIELDFLQFAAFEGEDIPEGVDELALRLGIDEFDEDVEAPGDAVQVDPNQILQLLFGGAPMTGLPGEGVELEPAP